MASQMSIRLGLSCLAALLLLFISTASAETCGLQNVVYDTIFEDGLDPPDAPVEGPPLSTVSPPVLGVAPTVSIIYPAAGAVLDTDRTAVIGYSGSREATIPAHEKPGFRSM